VLQLRFGQPRTVPTVTVEHLTGCFGLRFVVCCCVTFVPGLRGYVLRLPVVVVRYGLFTVLVLDVYGCWLVLVRLRLFVYGRSVVYVVDYGSRWLR